jgi:inositol-pentakisphosphate 2-kinase
MAQTLPQVTDTLPTEWRYISEGKSTIVFSYVGGVHPQLSGTVLRLRKALLRDPHEIKGIDDFSVEFHNEIISRLIPSQHLPRLVTAPVSRSWLGNLAAFHEAYRPLERRQEGQIDLTRKKAVLATDLIAGTELAVEIKVGIEPLS